MRVSFEQREVPVGNPRPVEKAPVRCAEHSQLPRCERVGEKVCVGSVRPGVVRVLRLHWADKIRNIRIAAADERLVLPLPERDREAGGEAYDAGKIPTAQQPPGPTALIERQRPVITDDEVVGHVVRR